MWLYTLYQEERPDVSVFLALISGVLCSTCVGFQTAVGSDSPAEAQMKRRDGREG